MRVAAAVRAAWHFLTQSLLPIAVLTAVIFGSLFFLERTGTAASRREVVVHLSADLLSSASATSLAVPMSEESRNVFAELDGGEDDAFLLSDGNVGSGDVPESALERRVLDAARKVDADSLDAALSDLTAVLAANPHHGSAWFLTGKIYSAREQLEEAAAAYSRAAEFSGGRAKAIPLYNLGCALRDLSRDEAAKDAFLQAIDRRPDYREARLNLALLLSKDPASREEAERAYDQLLRLYPDYSTGYFDRGLLRKAMDSDSLALADFRLAVLHDSLLTKGWIQIARLAEDAGRTDESLDAWYRVVEIDPESTRAWRALLLGLADQNRYEEAVTLGSRAVRIHPDWSAAWYNLGIAASRVERYDEARRAYERAIELEPHDFRPWLNLGVVLARQKRGRDAIRCYEEALAREPGSVSARYNLALERRRAGDLASALIEGERVFRLDPTSKVRRFLRTTAQRLIDRDGEDSAARRILTMTANSEEAGDDSTDDDRDAAPSE
ncbi:MAG: tetratricopeptide repeat protein [Candidatus Eisenbacteria bacterium]|uniref:Tetratricopeptide repeat protein n=1 Tax=Eiseniibacteriota bacterium TaxID=2212470 RepID=A0A956NDF8_UNCEI|nr:tetratricopeptide repeat protein [Candidatus Eisenbacteria bacterium]